MKWNPRLSELLSQSRDGYHAVGSSDWAASLRGVEEVYISIETISVLMGEIMKDSQVLILAIEKI